MKSLSSSEESGKELKTRSVLLLLEHVTGIITQSFYSTDIPNGVSNTLPSPFYSSPAAQQEDDSSSGEQQEDCKKVLPLDPLFALPRLEYPTGIQVVELGSKLYFLGGLLPDEIYLSDDEVKDLEQLASQDPKWKWMARLTYNTFSGISNICHSCTHPCNVYIFDLAKAKPKSSTTTCDPLEFLTEGTPMNYGKHKPQVFATKGKIFALGGHGYYPDNTPLFESFDPRADKWTTLAELPLKGEPHSLNGHVVVRNAAFIMVNKCYIYCYDLDNDQWLWRLCDYNLSSRLWGRSKFADNRIYLSFSQAAFVGNVPDADADEDEDGNLLRISPRDDIKYFSSEGEVDQGELEGEHGGGSVGERIFAFNRLLVISQPDDIKSFYNHQLPIWEESSCTIPLGNRHVCYVSLAHALRNPSTPSSSPNFDQYDRYSRYISATIAEASKDTNRNNDAFIGPKCLQSAHFVATTPWSSVDYIADYCSVLSVRLLPPLHTYIYI